jgi:hypothetical protein
MTTIPSANPALAMLFETAREPRLSRTGGKARQPSQRSRLVLVGDSVRRGRVGGALPLLGAREQRAGVQMTVDGARMNCLAKETTCDR